MITELEHHGILGMKWGVRRFQNKDGSLTAAGRVRYGYGDPSKSADLLARSKANVENTYKNSGDHVIRHVPEIDDAGHYLNEKMSIISENFNNYCDAVSSEIRALKNDSKLKDQIYKKLDADFGSSENIDDKEFLEMLVDDYIDELAIPKALQRSQKEYSSYIKEANEYYDDLSKIVDDIVGDYANVPIASITKTVDAGKTKILKKPIYKTEEIPVSYKTVVENTLHHLGNSHYVHYLLNHEEIAYLDDDGYEARKELRDEIINEWKKTE